MYNHTRLARNCFSQSSKAEETDLSSLQQNSHTKENPVHSFQQKSQLGVLVSNFLYWSSRTCRYFFSSRFSFSDMGGRS
jgi:hypothetical protein